MNIEDLSLNGRARDLDAGRPERRMEMPSSNTPMRPVPSSSRKDAQVAPLRPTVGRRMFRGFMRFIFTLLIGVGLTLGWQSYGEMARQMLATEAPGLAQLLPVSTMPPFAAASSPAPLQRLAPLTSDLDVVRRSLEQLAARQEQMAQTIAALQAVDEDIRQKILSTPAAQQPASIFQPKPIMQATGQSTSAPRRPPSATSPLR